MMGLFIKVLLGLVLVAFLGLTLYAYLGELSPDQSTIVKPVILNVDR